MSIESFLTFILLIQYICFQIQKSIIVTKKKKKFIISFLYGREEPSQVCVVPNEKLHSSVGRWLRLCLGGGMGSNPVTALILSGVFSAIANITARLQR